MERRMFFSFVASPMHARRIRSSHHSVARIRSSRNLRGMSSFVRKRCILLCLVCYVIAQHGILADDNNPYQFSFNIVDFQHRYEEKDAEGLINGEYGFITADGVYHETGYATDKNGDFIITKQRHRKITSLKDAQEIFKDRPEAAKKLVEAVMKACGGCKVPMDELPKPAKTVTESPLQKKMEPILKQMMKTLLEKHGEKEPAKDIVKSMMRAAKKLLLEENPNKIMSDRVLENMANDLYYRFNYTITTHGHHEDGYRNGSKDGRYQSRDENGINTQVKYLSNEFGHQPNITFAMQTNTTDQKHAFKGYLFRWYWP